MKSKDARTLVTVSTLVISGVACVSSRTSLPLNSSVATISTGEIIELFATHENRVTQRIDSGTATKPSFVLVDVRSEKESDVSIIPGAITKEQFEQGYEHYKDRLVIAYCTVGWRSERFAKELVGKGVDAKNYAGSILNWIEAGLPLATLDGQPTNHVHTYADRYDVPAGYVKEVN